MSEPTIFERIVAREIPADIVFENDRIIAFVDVAQKAPVHLLVVPKTAQYENVAQLAAGDPGLMAEVVKISDDLASQLGGGQYRLVFNSGERAGQTVFHVHAHVLANPSGTLEEGSLGQL